MQMNNRKQHHSLTHTGQKIKKIYLKKLKQLQQKNNN